MYLSKSKYLTGLQCPKALWINYNAKTEIPPVPDSLQAIFDQGHDVGDWAKKVFPGGLDIRWDAGFDEVIRQSAEMLAKRIPLFEPGFRGNNTYARVDVLNPAGTDEWDIIEVKSSTNVKNANGIFDDVYLHDIAFQKYCCTKNGLKIRKTYLMYLNRDYIRKGDIDPQKLFIIDDVTTPVNDYLTLVPDNITHMLGVIRGARPEVKVGRHCNNPYSCALIPPCWDFLPENNVFNLTRISNKGYELIDQGKLKITDIPTDYALSDKQEIQRRSVVNNRNHIDKDGIKKFLDRLVEPVHYFDIETCNPAVPLYDGMRAYQHFPFQYSLHIQENGKIEHIEFLDTDPADPRPALLESMRKSFKNKGSIMVYFQSFESNKLIELAEAFPQYRTFIEGLLSRFVDLYDVFANLYYYDPVQKGSASLKYTMPALTGKGYDDLEISDGMAAMREYRRITFSSGITVAEKERVRKELLKYCCQDTEGMIWMVDELRVIVS